MDYFKDRLSSTKQSAEEAIPKLCDRLQHATLPSDRKSAILGLKSFARTHRESVVENGLRPLVAAFKKDGVEDADVARVLMETFVILLIRGTDDAGIIANQSRVQNGKYPSPLLVDEIQDQLSMWIADELTADVAVISDVLEIIASSSGFQLKLYALQLLEAVVATRPKKTKQVLLELPTAVSTVVELLHSDHDPIRNEAILLLMALANGNYSIQKLIAFENCFDRLFDIIAEEGGIRGSILVQDCLTLLTNLLQYNASNQSLFMETGGVARLQQLIGEPVYGGVDEITGTPLPPIEWNEQRLDNLSMALEICGTFCDEDSELLAQNQSRLADSGVLLVVLQLVFTPNLVPVNIKVIALEIIAAIISGNPEIQLQFSQIDVPCIEDPSMPINLHAVDKLVPVTLVLVNWALNTNSVHWFDLRMAASNTLHAFFKDNHESKSAFLADQIKAYHEPNYYNQPVDGEAESTDDYTPNYANLFHVLMDYNPDIRLNPYKAWFAGVILMYTFEECEENKDLALQVSTGSEDGEEEMTCIEAMSELLVASLEAGNDERIAITYFMLFTYWMYEDFLSVDDFLRQPSVVKSILAYVSGHHSESELSIVTKSMAAVCLGVSYEFSTASSPTPRKQLHQLLTKSMGKDNYSLRVKQLRQNHQFKHFDDEIKSENVGLPEVYFDRLYVDVVKTNFGRIRRALFHDPLVEPRKAITFETFEELESDYAEVKRKLLEQKVQTRETEDRLNGEITKLTVIAEQLTVDIAEKSAKLTAIDEEYSKTKTSFEATSTALEEMESLQKKATEEVASLRTQLADHQKNSSGLSQSSKQLEARLAEVEEAKSKLEQGVNKMNKELFSLQREKNDSENRVKKLTKELDSLNKQHTKATSSLNQQVAGHGDRAAALEAKFAQMEQDHTSGVHELATVKARLHEVEETNGHLMDKLRSAGAVLAGFKADNERLEADLANKVAKHRQQLAELDSGVAGTSSVHQIRVQQLEEELEELRDGLEEIEVARDLFQAELDVEREQAELAAKRHHQEVSQLKLTVEELRAKVEMMVDRSEIDTVKKELVAAVQAAKKEASEAVALAEEDASLAREMAADLVKTAREEGAEALEKKKKEVAEVLEKKEKELTEVLEKREKEFSEELQQKENEFTEKVDALHKEWNNRPKEIPQEKVTELQLLHEKQLESLQKTHASQLHEIEQNHQYEIDAMKQKLADCLEMTTASVRLTSLEKEHQQATENANHLHAQELKRLKLSLESAHSEKLSLMKSEMESNHFEELRCLKVQLETSHGETNSPASDLELQLHEKHLLVQRLENELQAAKRVHQDEIDNIKATHQQQLASRQVLGDGEELDFEKLHQASKEELETLKTAHEKEIAKFSAANAAAEENHLKTLDRVSKLAEARIREAMETAKRDVEAATVLAQEMQSQTKEATDIVLKEANVKTLRELADFKEKLEKALGANDQLVADHEEERTALEARFNTEFDQLQQEHLNNVDKMKQAHDGILADLNNLHEIAESESRQKLLAAHEAHEETKKQHKNALELAEAQHADALQLAVATYGEATTKAEHAHETTLRKMEEAHAQGLEALEANHKKETAQLKLALEEKLSKTHEGEQELAVVKSQHFKQLQDLANDHQESFRVAEASYNENIKKVDATHIENLKRVQSEGLEKLQVVQAAHAEEMKRVEEEHNLRIQKVELAVASKLRASDADHEQEMNKLKEAHEGVVLTHEQVKQGHEETLEALKSTHGQTLEALKSTHDEELEHFKTSLTEELELLKSTHGEELRALEEEKSKQLENHQKTIEELIDAHEKKYSDDDASRQQAAEQQRMAHQAAIDEFTSSIGEKDSVIESLSEKVESFTEQLMEAKLSLDEKSDVIQALKDDLKTAKQQASDAETAIGTMRDKVDELSAKVRDAEQAEAKATLEAKEVREKLSTSESKVTELTSNYETVSSLAEATKSELESTKFDLSTALSDAKDLKKELDTLEKDHANLVSAFSEAQRTIEVKCKAVASLEGEASRERAKVVAEYSDKLKLAQEETDKQASALQGLKDEIAVLKDDLETTERIRERDQRFWELEKNQQGDVASQLEKITKDHQQLNESHESISSEHAELTAQLGKVTKDHQIAVKAAEMLKFKLGEAEAAQKELQQRIESDGDDSKTLESELKEKLVAAETQLAETNAAASDELEKIKEMRMSEAEEFRQQLADAGVQLSHLKEQLDAVTERGGDSEDLLEKERAKTALLGEELENVTKTAEEELASLKESLEKEICSLKGSLQKELSTWKDSNANLKQKLVEAEEAAKAKLEAEEALKAKLEAEQTAKVKLEAAVTNAEDVAKTQINQAKEIASEEIKQLEEKLASVNKNATAVVEDGEKKEAEINEANDKISSLMEAVAKAKKDSEDALQEKESVIGSLKADFDKKDELIATKDKEIASLNQELSKLDLSADVASKDEEIASLQAAIENMKKETAEKVEVMATEVARIKELEIENMRLKDGSVPRQELDDMMLLMSEVDDAKTRYKQQLRELGGDVSDEE